MISNTYISLDCWGDEIFKDKENFGEKKKLAMEKNTAKKKKR